MKKTSMFVALPIALVCSSVMANGMTQLDDEQLSAVNGQDGVYLNLKNFSFNSATGSAFPGLTLTYTMPYEGTGPSDGDPLIKDPSKPVSYIQYSGISISRTDPIDPNEIFTDPYQIQIQSVDVPTEIQLPALDPSDPLYKDRKQEVIRILNPKNLNGSTLADKVRWNMTYDWTVATDVATGHTPVIHDMGAHIVQDMAIYGGGISLAPAWSYKDKDDVRGAAWGLDLNVQIGAYILQPRGRTDNGTYLELSNIRIGAANASKTGVDTDLTKTWRVADVITQPGIINAITTTDSNGLTSTVLHMGIEWYRGANEADIPTGAMSVDQVTIKNGPASAPTVTNFGGASIGGIQIRYLDVIFRNPY